MNWVKKLGDPITTKRGRQLFQKAILNILEGNDPGPVPFQLERSKRASVTYPLKLTQQQRDSSIHCIRLNRSLKHKLEQAGEGTQIVGVTRKELDALHDECGEASVFAPSPHPRCVAGARSGPPEDIVGIWGYEEYLEAIANPKHKRHDEFMEWNGGWDAEKFSVTEINEALRGFSRR
jgi:Plasmid pRiA4b ORF-3-like protein